MSADRHHDGAVRSGHGVGFHHCDCIGRDDPAAAQISLPLSLHAPDTVMLKVGHRTD